MAYKYANHLLHCFLMFAIVICFEVHAAKLRNAQPVSSNPWTTYGIPATVTLYFLRLFVLLTLPAAAFSFLGLALFDAFPRRVAPAASKLFAPHICFRVVTRGNFPRLVEDTVTRNLATCVTAGLQNFTVEVVCDVAVNVTPRRRVTEVVVPDEYRTEDGSLFKARALQYCLEDGVNQLSDGEWIVHLDEETLLTEDSVNGIVNFVSEGKHPFGQGLVTYANEEIVSWWSTLADMPRVAVDMGCRRFLSRFVHRPLVGCRGSFMVAQVGAERRVTFDNGAAGSVTEASFFALKADQLGYTFGFVDGDMWEKSAFTLADSTRQRRRWMQGFFLVAKTTKIPLRHRIVFMMSVACVFALPIPTAGIMIGYFFPIPVPALLDTLITFCLAMNAYHCIFGFLKSFSVRRHGLLKIAAILCGSLCVIPLLVVLSNVAAIWACFGKRHQFYIVDKNVPSAMSAHRRSFQRNWPVDY